MVKQFKYLERFLLKDIEDLLMIYKDFFITNKEYIKTFAADSIAFLLRKLPIHSLNSTIDFMLSLVTNTDDSDPNEEDKSQRDELCSSIGTLLFSIVQGIKNQFRTNAGELIPIFLSKLVPDAATNTAEILSIGDEDEEIDTESLMDVDTVEKETPKMVEEFVTDNTTSSVMQIDQMKPTKDFDYVDRYHVLLAFVKSVRSSFGKEDKPLIWTCLETLLSQILASELSDGDKLASLESTFHLIFKYLEKRHLPDMSLQNQSSILQHTFRFWNQAVSSPKLLSILFQHPSTQNSQEMDTTDQVQQAKRLLLRLGQVGCEFIKLVSSTHSQAAASMDKKLVSSSISEFIKLSAKHPAICFEFLLQASKASGSSQIFTQAILPTIITFVETSSQSINKSSLQDEMGLHCTHFLTRFVDQLDFGSLPGTIYLDTALDAINISSNYVYNYCISIVQNHTSCLAELKPMEFSCLWLALKTLACSRIPSEELLTNAVASIDNMIANWTSNRSSKQQTMVWSEAFFSMTRLVRLSSKRFSLSSASTLVRILELSIGYALKHRDNRRILQALVSALELANIDFIDDPEQYLSAKNYLFTQKEELQSILKAAAQLVSSSDSRARSTAWKLLKSIAALIPSIKVHQGLINICDELLGMAQNLDPLQHKTVSSKLPDVVEMAIQPSATEFDRELAFRFLFGILFVPFTPLWPPTIREIDRLAGIDSTTFWRLVVPLLEFGQRGIGFKRKPIQKDESERFDMWAAEMSLPSEMAEDLERFFDSPDTTMQQTEESKANTSRYSSFSNSIWSCMRKAAPALASTSQAASEIGELFIAFMDQHFPHLYDVAGMNVMSNTYEEITAEADKKASDVDPSQAQESELETIPDEFQAAETNQQSQVIVGEIRNQLHEYLLFFANIRSPEGLKKGDKIWTISEKVLVAARADIQRAAIDCLCTWKESTYIIPYKDALYELTADTRVRIPFTNFPLKTDRTKIEGVHRQKLVPIIIRLLFPKLSLTLDDAKRRGAVLAYLAQLEPSECQPLFDLTHGLFNEQIAKVEQMIFKNDVDDKGKPSSKKRQSASQLDIAKLELPSLNKNQLVGSLSMLNDMVKYMGVSTELYIVRILTIPMIVLHQCHANASEVSQQLRLSNSQLTTLRKACTKVITSVMALFDAWDYGVFKQELTRLMLLEAQHLERQEQLVSVSPFLLWCDTISARPALLPILAPFVKHIIQYLKRPDISQPVKANILGIIENVLKVRSGSRDLSNKLQLSSTDSNDNPKRHTDAVPSIDANSLYLGIPDILIPYANDLLDAMQARMFIDMSKTKKKFGMKELWILEQLTEYATTSTHADKLVSLLLTFSKRPTLKEETRERILSIFCRMISLLTNPLMYVEHIKRLFLTIPDWKSRLQLCDIVDHFGKLDETIREIAPLIRSLNAMSKQQVESPDFEERMKSYHSINEDLLKTLKPSQLSFIVCNYLCFVRNDDISIRNNAAFGISKIITQISAESSEDTYQTIIGTYILPEIKKQINSESELVRREFLALLSSLVTQFPSKFPELAQALGQDEEHNFFLTIHHLQTYRRVRALVRLTEQINKHLYTKSSMVQYFFPVIRRIILSATLKQHAVVDEAIKATTAMASQLNWSSYSQLLQTCFRGMSKNPTIQNQWIKLLCSIINNFHFEVGTLFEDVLAESRPKKIVVTIKSQFNAYKPDTDDQESIVSGELNLNADEEVKGNIKPKEDESETSSSEAESVSDTSSSDDANDEDQHQSEESSNTEKEEVEEKDNESEDKPQDNQETSEAEMLQKQIQRSILNSIVPHLVRLMKTKEKENKQLRTNVVVSAVSLLNRLPMQVSQPRIARFVIEVANQLSSRTFSNRLAANAAIQEILKVLGPTKFLFLTKTLVVQLRKGYQLHILSSTIATLLKAVQHISEPGEIDEGIEMLNKVFFEEMIGHVAEQKNVQKIKSVTKEANKTYAYESIGIVAQIIDFQKSIRRLVDPIFDVILASNDPKIIRKMTTALHEISIGIRANSSSTPEKMCIFIFQLVDQYSKSYKVEEKKQLNDLENNFMIEQNPYKKTKTSSIHDSSHTGMAREVNNDHVIVTYALQLLHSLLKGSGLSPKNHEHIGLLDPFVPILAKLIRSRHNDVLVISLRCLTTLLKYPLRTLQGKAQALAEATIHLLQKSSIGSDLPKMCFKSLARILSTPAKLKLDDDLIIIAMGYIRESLESNDPQDGLILLRAMIGRKYLVEDIYLAMKKVNELLVHTTLDSTRSSCDVIISTFLLTYPLDAKRLSQQLEFVMANLMFEESNGRLAILQLLRSLFNKFPEELLNKHVDYFYLPLVAQMVNDEDPKCRGAASHAIETLYLRVSATQSEQLLQKALKWYENDESRPSLQRASAQLLIIFSQAMGGARFLTFAKRLIPTFSKRLDASIEDVGGVHTENILEHATDEQWQSIYFTLLAIEKSLTLAPSLILKDNLIPIWKSISTPQVLSFPHPWVRMASSRLLGLYFATRKEKMPITLHSSSGKNKTKSHNQPEDWIAEPRKIFSITKLFCNMLELPDLSEELGTQVIKNLFWLVLQLQQFPDITPQQQIDASRLVHDEQIDSADEAEITDDENGNVEKESESDKESDNEEMDVDASEDGDDKIEENNGNGAHIANRGDFLPSDNQGVPAVSWVFRRLSYMTKNGSNLSKTCIFKFFAAMAMSLEVEEVKRYLLFMLFPLFRANEAIYSKQSIASARVSAGKSVRAESPEFVAYSELVHEVAEMLRKKVGTTFYYEVHEKVRSRVLNVRQKRKSDLALQAVLNPAKFALRKAARAKKSSIARKRKIDAYTAHRTTDRIKVRKMK